MATIKNSTASTPGLGALSQPENNRGSGISSKAKVPVIDEGDILDSPCHAVGSAKVKNAPEAPPGILKSLFSLFTPKKDNGAFPMPVVTPDPPSRSKNNGADPSPSITRDPLPRSKNNGADPSPGITRDPLPRSKNNGADPSPSITRDTKALKESPHKGSTTPPVYIPTKKDLEKAMKDIEKGVRDMERGIPPLINESEEVPKKAKQTISKKKE